MDPAQYRPIARDIPEEPGVYRFLDARNTVIYVGKAKNLRSRLSSYFADPASLHPRTHTMVHTAESVTWTVVATEVEALQLEYSWIKQFDPRFNVKYKDDKSYPYFAVSLADEYPRASVVRGAKRRGTKYFGPYAHAWAIRETLDLLLRVFPVRTCSRTAFHRAQRADRPCLLGYIDKCAAPCVGRVDATEHRNIVDGLISFMSGNTAGVLNELERQMHTAAEQLDFETAARRRDDIGALTKVMEKSAVVLPDATDADVFALVADELDASVYGFHVRGGRIRGQRGWVVERVAVQDEAELMRIALRQIYGESSAEAIPRELLLSVTPTGAEVIQEWLNEKRGAGVDIRVPQRGDKKDLLETVAKNARNALVTHKTKRTSDLTSRTRALTEIQEHLELPEAPLRIECFDISTLHGTHTVASMVVFEDGLPRKSDYRTFTISKEAAHDDLASMREVITRRFSRYLAYSQNTSGAARINSAAPSADAADDSVASERSNSFAYPPQLVVVDGGAPQVQAAYAALQELGLHTIHVCGIAKRLEEIWLPGDDYPIIFPRGSTALYLIQHLRDEAHRFAIKHHRSKRAKAMTQSVLDNVAGLGPARAKVLLDTFGSPAAVKAAGPAKIQELPGFGPKLTEAVMVALTNEQSSPGINTATGEILEESPAKDEA